MLKKGLNETQINQKLQATTGNEQIRLAQLGAFGVEE